MRNGDYEPFVKFQFPFYFKCIVERQGGMSLFYLPVISIVSNLSERGREAEEGERGWETGGEFGGDACRARAGAGQCQRKEGLCTDRYKLDQLEGQCQRY